MDERIGDSKMAPPGFEPTAVVPLTGDEAFAPGIRVRDFWSWGFSDLRLNTVRGSLAQFLVARAVGDTRATDEGWGNFDVLTTEGIRVEVKSSAYLQSWRQTQLSKIEFKGLTGRSWTDTEGYSAQREVRADVFVFAVHTCQEPSSYDPLDLAYWEFWVLPATVIKVLAVRSISLATIRRHTSGAVAWDGLADAVRRAVQLDGERAGRGSMIRNMTDPG